MTVGIASARLGDLSVDQKVNVRRAGRGAEPVFTASIRAKGVIEPLIVRQNGNGLTITNGSKRFDALMFLKSKGESANGVPVTDDYPVPVVLRAESDAEARETSLMANIHAPLHPVDQFEAFAQMIADGATLDEIGARYVMKVPQVRQALSLAAIAPEIRKAWRDGKIDGEAAEAYAQTQDLQHQVRIFNKLKNRAGEGWAIGREILGEGDHRISQLLKFVGEKEFEAAGHHVNHSLFDDDERNPITVDNVPALKAMAAAKIAAECERLKADGWGWAIPKDQAPRDIYSWRHLPSSTPSKEQKAHAGCTVGISYQGALEVNRGYIKPGDKVKIEKTPAQKKAAKKAKETKDESGGISAALALRLSQQITRAARDVLETEPTLALRLAVCAIASGEGYNHESPAKITHGGMAELDDGEDREFDEYWKLTAGKSVSELLKTLATFVAISLDMQCHAASSLPLTGEYAEDDGAGLLLNALPAKALNAALRKAFDVADYFASVPADVVRVALVEITGVKPAGSEKKAALVQQAIAAHKGSLWLPPELRTAHYDGPGAGKAPGGKGGAKKKRGKR